MENFQKKILQKNFVDSNFFWEKINEIFFWRANIPASTLTMFRVIVGRGEEPPGQGLIITVEAATTTSGAIHVHITPVVPAEQWLQRLHAQRTPSALYRPMLVMLVHENI